MATNAEHAMQILALAWASFSTPIFDARTRMEKYLDEHFPPKLPLGYVPCTRVGDHKCTVNGPCNGYPRTQFDHLPEGSS